MDEKSFLEVVPNHIQNDTGQLRSALRIAINMANEKASNVYHLSKFICAAVYFGHFDFFCELIDLIYDVHRRHLNDVEYSSKIVSDLYLIGSLAVRLKR